MELIDTPVCFIMESELVTICHNYTSLPGRLHHLRQRDRQTEIAGKILLEEERMEKRRQQQPQLFPDPAKEKQKVYLLYTNIF